MQCPTGSKRIGNMCYKIGRFDFVYYLTEFGEWVRSSVSKKDYAKGKRGRHDSVRKFKQEDDR